MRRMASLLFITVFAVFSLIPLYGGGEREGESEQKIVPEDPGPFGKYLEPITITAVANVRPPEFSEVPADLNPENHSWIRLVKDYLNIDLKFLWTVPTDQFSQKFSLAVAAGDLPNIMKLEQEQLHYFELFKESNILADLTEAYEKYASPWLKEICESDGGYALNACKQNGKLMALPYYTDPFQLVELVWIRADWLQKLDLDPPKTMKDLIGIAKAFTENDPDGNKKDDTYGLAMHKKLFFWGFTPVGLFYGHHAYPEMWIKDGKGGLVYGTIQPEVRDALATLQKMYKEGLIDLEYAVKDFNRVVEDIIAGKIGLLFGRWWYPNWPLNMNREKQPEADWQCYEIVSVDENPAKNGVKRVKIDSYNVVNRTCKHPEAAIKMMNLYHDLSEKKHGEIATPRGGFVYHWVPQYVYYPFTQQRNFFAINRVLDAGGDESLLPEYISNVYDLWGASKKYVYEKDLSGWGLYFSRVAKDGGWGLTEMVRESGRVEYDEYYGSKTPTQVEKGESLERLRDEVFHRIIMGAPLAEFDAFVENWKKLGGNDITREINEWYAKMKM